MRIYLSRRCGIDTELSDCMSEVGGEFETAIHGCMMDSGEFKDALHGCKSEIGEFEVALHGCKLDIGEFEGALHGCKSENGQFEAKFRGCMLESRELDDALHGGPSKIIRWQFGESSRRGVVAGTRDSWTARALKEQAFCEEEPCSIALSCHLIWLTLRLSPPLSHMHVRSLFILRRWCRTIRVVHGVGGGEFMLCSWTQEFM